MSNVVNTVWDAFVGRHTGSRFLGLDPLYSLSGELIDAIVENVPGFFTNDEELFERDLARTARFGFFLRKALGSTDEVREGHELTLAERKVNSDAALAELTAEELRRAGNDPEEIQEYFVHGNQQRKRIVDRQDAYAGWLVLDPCYREEVRQLRKRWEGAVRVAGRFPRLPLWLIPDPTDEIDLPPDFRDECFRFFSRWGLDTLLTWDWPVPMEPDLNAGLRENINLLSQGGMVLFVPWYLLRGGKLDLRGVAQQSRLMGTPDHLLDWVMKRGRPKGADLGDVRYATIQWLYRYYELALRRRYPDACDGNLQRLDCAFASVIQREEDTVRKLRFELQRNGHLESHASVEGC